MDFVAEDTKKRKLNSDDSNGYSVSLSKDDLKRLLEPLSKEQLVALLIDAGSQYPAVADDIRDVASKDPAHRKLFVRGLAWETTSQALRDAFQHYGEIEEGAVITDKATGKSRGFGFITFKHMDSAQRALKEPSKTIDGRITVCNLASVGSSAGAGSADQAQRKLYIGGLSYETSNETLLNIFSQYGEIEEGAVAYDKNTNKSRGFAFITYKSVEAARKAIDDPNKTIEGRHVIVKLAAEGQKEKAVSQSSAQNQGGPQVQAGYSVINPNLPAFARPTVAGAGTPALGFSPYTPGLPAYTSQPAYATSNPQYGGVTAAMPQYNPAQYAAQYGIPTPQPGQLPAGGGNGAGGVPTYYASAS
ncbi:hypothetical protein SELMODRAFT_163608 [Selaginella moellendorffii]|uniref:RRM domain-containing protein n=1 Tax=Selaginella moellendorffii TaxID=88036 RepID=D8QPR6_SELML|nr:UBP1-associated protein 2C [Selaginella moellendorffii]XP_024544838.1 UBP1-associated protein 2C [Selaginella moellendorffii]EFJ38326.1 hypothetical protein SELMODRAFT_163608 [Selaginella moellendorffii]|eukprot:XP_002960787.1 UBP1-associated protein 2C [Selaginella moellendorffii]